MTWVRRGIKAIRFPSMRNRARVSSVMAATWAHRFAPGRTPVVIVVRAIRIIFRTSGWRM
jgi:hypothetical protein